jgi:hypothetical protein
MLKRGQFPDVDLVLASIDDEKLPVRMEWTAMASPGGSIKRGSQAQF